MIREKLNFKNQEKKNSVYLLISVMCANKVHAESILKIFVHNSCGTSRLSIKSDKLFWKKVRPLFVQ